MVTATKTYNLLIGGQIKSAVKGGVFDAVNPSNGETFSQIADGDFKDINLAIIAAKNAFDNGSWSGLTFAERGKYLVKIAQAIRAVECKVDVPDAGPPDCGSLAD